LALFVILFSIESLQKKGFFGIMPTGDASLRKKLKAFENYRLTPLLAGVLLSLFGSLFAYPVFAVDALPVEPAALRAVGLREVVESDPNLTGLDVHIAAVCRSMTYLDGVPQSDYHFAMNHSALFGADVIFEDGSNGQTNLSSHATAIGGILVGLDPNGYHPQTGSFNYIGACPDATVEVFEFWRFVSLYVFSGRPFDADIVTLSLGEVFPGWWTRGIEKLAAEKGLVVFAAAGNGRRVYDPILYPAAGANVIAVGVVNAVPDPAGHGKSLVLFSTSDPNNSSTGPTADGRCKPDIVAPGRCLVPNVDTEGGYSVEGDWSSLATPVAVGAAAILIQKARSEPDLAVPMFAANTNSVIKAILLTSADKLPFWHKGLPGVQDDVFCPLDYSQGAGALNVSAAYKLLTAGWKIPGKVKSAGWDNNVLDPNTPATYAFQLPSPAGQYITATLCWNRHYGGAYPFEPEYEKDADLQLELWAVDTNDPRRDTLLYLSDSAGDNVEHIYFSADPNYTDYQLVVREKDSRPTRQPYAIAWTTGADTSANNPYWYDLNNDGVVNAADELIAVMLEHSQTGLLDSLINGSAQFNLSASRVEILQSNWPEWRKHLLKWNVVAGRQ
jgi:hypothetical protein